MKKMKYSLDNIREVLYEGKYLGYQYYIVSYGSHPCVYVKIPEDNQLYHKKYMDLDFINCHGGLTYSDSFLPIESYKTFKNDEWYLGWDYAHIFDYTAFYELIGLPNHPLKKWTTGEIKEECKKVIKELKDYER